MRGPKRSDYDGDRDAYESAYCSFEANEDTERERQRDEKQENEKGQRGYEDQ